MRLGRDTIACPTVNWQAWIAWTTVNGEPVVKGGANLLTPIQ